MANHAVMIPNAVAAKDIDAWNRSAVASVDVDNGNIVILTTRSSTAGEGEVFNAVTPSTSDGLTGVWIVGEPEVVLTDGKYKGLDPNPQHFYNVAGDVFTVFKPALGDIITLTAEGLAGTKSTNGYAIAVNSTGGLKPVWNSTAGSGVFALKLLETSYISIADGSIGNQRTTAYVFEVVAL